MMPLGKGAKRKTVTNLFSLLFVLAEMLIINCLGLHDYVA
jgi:hypothetical protein